MHRSAARHTTLSPVERESRRRTWWVLYFFDRFSASKIGQPITVRDEDIDVEMPSMDDLTRDEMKEFLDPRNLVINIKLAKIIGNIRKSTWFIGSLFIFLRLLTCICPPVTQIYGIPKATKGLYIHQVHSILNQLRAWQDELPPDMRVVERSTPRPVASLHLAYNQCIVQTTRPVLLHLFKMQFHLSKAREAAPQKEVSGITLALAESCINAAQASSRLVESLFLDGSIATFGFWDAHHIFSAAMILIMSAIMKPTAANSDLLETLLSVLRSLKSNGNIPAVDFCERLSQIQARVSELRAEGKLGSVGGGLSGRARWPTQPSQVMSSTNAAQERPPIETPTSIRNDIHSSESIPNHMDIDDVLGDPVIGNFLDGNQMQLLDAILPEGGGGGIPSDFASDLDEQFLFGSW
jgi:proline utilization trans-activator